MNLDDLEDYSEHTLEDLTASSKEVSFEDALASIFGEGDVNIAALFRLSDMGPDAHNQFLTKWNQAEDSRRFVIARHLADISEENFEVEFAPLFKQFLDDKSDAVRLAALDGLWDTTSGPAILAIIRLLETDESDEVRKSAASTLAHVILLGEWGQVSARFRDKSAEALVAQHRNLNNPIGLRRAALESLGASSHEQVPTLIRAAYESGDADMQLSAMFAMGNSADVSWISTIIAEMSSPYPEMRAEAARASGELGSSDAIAPLADLVFDVAEDVQLAAVASLGKLGSDRATDLLKQFAEDDELEHLHAAIAAALADGTDVLDGSPFDPFDEDDDDEDDWDVFDEDADYLSF